MLRLFVFVLYSIAINFSYSNFVLLGKNSFKYSTGFGLPKLSAGVNPEFKVFFWINCLCVQGEKK